jgi:hypothetical protein
MIQVLIRWPTVNMGASFSLESIPYSSMERATCQEASIGNLIGWAP